MSEMVERVAVAIRIHLMSIDCGFEMTDDEATGMARAAIEAMLEPTEAMILSQGKSKPENAATETQRERAEALNLSVRRLAAVTWREMIQAALKEQE